MPVHDWTRVNAGTFHDFHSGWIIHLKDTLNDGFLPTDYYAMAEQHARDVVPDVLTLTTSRAQPRETVPDGAVAVAEAPPKVSLTMTSDSETAYILARRTLTIRHTTGHRIVAMLEIVSPGNKNRASALRDFLDKAISAIKQGIHLLVIDLHPPGRHDPDGIHGAIWDELLSAPFSADDDKPLTLAAYVANSMSRAYVEPIAVGSILPDMPLFLTPDYYINAPLEQTYVSAYRGVPAFWRDVIEGRRSAPPEQEE
jgi:hypothetical protein